MSAAAAAEDATVVPPKRLSKKLIIIIAAVAVLLLGGAGAAFFVVKKHQAEAAEADDGDEADAEAAPVHKAKKDDHKAPPTFVALDPFTVNLADVDHERFAQIGITLEVDDPKFAEEMKAYLPAVRAGILMILAHKTSQELLSREGKEALAGEVMREAVRPMGIEIDDEDAPDEAAEDTPKKKKKKKRAPVHNPVQRVLFSSFIIQ